MQYSETDLRNVKKIEVEILQEIMRVCKKMSITYFAVGGTALGAVRHNGFIPWDDDIDIGMMRDDYEKFLKVAPKELNDKFELVHYSLYKDHPVYFAKVKMKGTLFVERGTSKLKIPKGIFVDIMPYDYCPSTRKQQIKYVKKTIFLNNLFVTKTISVSSFENKKSKRVLKTFIRKIIHFLILPIPKKYLYHKLDSHLQKYNGKCDEFICQNKYINTITKYDIVFPTSEHIFENIVISMPGKQDAFLKSYFGNYMELPPKEKQITHSPELLKY